MRPVGRRETGTDLVEEEARALFTDIHPADRVRIGGHAGALFGRIGTAVEHSVDPRAWVVTLDPSTDEIPGDYYPHGGTVTVATRALAVERGGDWWSQPYMGQCDGCESEALQRVRDVSGAWGAATVCPYHQDHVS